MNHEPPDVQAGFRKGRGTRDQIASIHWFRKSKRIPEEFWFCFITMLKPLTMWITTNCGKFFKRWKYQTTFTCLLRNLCAGQEAIVRTRHGTADLFRIGKAIHQGCHPAYLTYMKSTSCEIPGWMKHKLESRLPGEISITSDMQMIPPNWQKEKRN